MPCAQPPIVKNFDGRSRRTRATYGHFHDDLILKFLDHRQRNVRDGERCFAIDLAGFVSVDAQQVSLVNCVSSHKNRVSEMVCYERGGPTEAG